ncbi:alkaline phosphatase family protein [Candidatus Omnitrophota bacterium]
MRNNSKTIIIGLDGVPLRLLKDLADKGVMPNTRGIISKGILKKMQSSIPEISSVAWSSIITGKKPAEHGIFGFTDLYPNSYELMFPNFNDLKTPPFWNSIDGESIIINVPSTYPVREINGVHISGFVSIDFDKSVYPKTLITKLKELDYCLDVDSRKAHKSADLFLADLDKTLKSRIQAYRYLWGFPDWHVFMLVFTGTDRLMHFLWDAYEDPNHKYHKDFLGHFHMIDEVIGEINANISEEDSLIMLSDHGFERLDKDVYINYILRKEGFLKLKETNEPSISSIDYPTKAFALDPARIYINWKDKYPCGSVDRQDKQRVLKDLVELFSSLEIDNKNVVRDVYRKEEIYSGSLLEQAPDLVLVGNQGFNLKANIKADKLADKTIFTGKHTQSDAFLFINQSLPEPSSLDKVEVSDVVNILKNMIYRQK